MVPKTKQDPESVVKEIKRKTRRKFNSEEKIRIILEGLRGEDSIANICRKEGIVPGIYYKWSKAFLEAGKRQLNGDHVEEAYLRAGFKHSSLLYVRCSSCNKHYGLKTEAIPEAIFPLDFSFAEKYSSTVISLSS